MALRILVRGRYGESRRWVSNVIISILLKKGVILICQSILETRWKSRLHGSALFTIPLKPTMRSVFQVILYALYLTILNPIIVSKLILMQLFTGFFLPSLAIPPFFGNLKIRGFVWINLIMVELSWWSMPTNLANFL